MAARGAGAACEAGDRIAQRHIAEANADTVNALRQGPKDSWLCRGRERSDRISLGRKSNRQTTGAGGRFGSPAGGGDLRNCSSATLAAKAATATVPIVFFTGGDPIKLGLVASFNRPGGNVTGVSTLSNALVAKQVELLHDLVPKANVLAFLVNPSNPIAESDGRDIQGAAHVLGLQLLVLNASTERDFEAAFSTLIQRERGALLIATDPFLNSRSEQLVALAARHALAAMHTRREFAVAGGLMSYGSSLTDVSRQVGIYVGRILRGESQPTSRSCSRPSSN